MTRWRPIPGYPSYEASDDGRIRRAAPGNHGGVPAGLVLKATLKATGYLRVNVVAADGRRRGHHVHRLAALAFLGPPPTPRHQAAHRDGNSLNNVIANLYWATPEENYADRARHGAMALGERAPWARLTVSIVRDLRSGAFEGWSHAALGRRYGVSPYTIADARRGITWRHVSSKPALDSDRQPAQ